MTYSRKINHRVIETGLFLVAVLLISLANCVSFMHTGTVPMVNVFWTVGSIAGVAWHARKL